MPSLGAPPKRGVIVSSGDEKFYRARITQRADYSADLWMIRIQTEAEFKFAPGQYATLGVQDAEKRHERPYPIVSSPYESEIEFFFELVPQGELTPRSEEHTSELQSPCNLVCRLLLE